MSPDHSLKAWMAPHLQRIEQALAAGIDDKAPAHLGQAMRYAVLGGGKRLRPLLVLASAHAARAGDGQAALRAACAVELIHAYSLVHDDMPCMDNDALRRGKPTVHVQFGQAQALLAGDALQALAFEWLTPALDAAAPAAQALVQAQCVHLLARASGYWGMAGGQAIDLASVGHTLTQAQLQQMHQLKTGALLACSVRMGLACGQPLPPAALAALGRCGDALGLAFQVVDDILDVQADTLTLGKTAGKDAAADKPTYVSLMGMQAAQRCADDLAQQALQALSDTHLPAPAVQPLMGLVQMVVGRQH